MYNKFCGPHLKCFNLTPGPSPLERGEVFKLMIYNKYFFHTLYTDTLILLRKLESR
jgi:hypothetical protein